ncbi:MAG: ATP-binding protein [Casimicrobiaceae bacterium]
MPPPIEPEARRFLEGTDETAALMRALDWSSTSLGPPELWPQSLKTVASVCLHSRFPMLIWWGPELVMLYNDAYRPILGQKHPRALGQQGQECWPEIWDLIGPLLRGVMAGASATWAADQLLMLERNGYPEECFFTFSYSPIFDESGGIGGVFTAVTETTEIVVAQRRTGTLNRLTDALAELRDPGKIVRTGMSVLAGEQRDVLRACIASIGQGPLAQFLVSSDADSAADLQSDPGFVSALEIAVAGNEPQLYGLGPIGAESETPRRFIIEPINLEATVTAAHALVIGLNPHRGDDPGYRSFIAQAAERIGTALNRAHTYDAERRRAEALAELDRAKSIFFSNVSHELRTPLTLIMGPLEEALDGLAETPQAEPLRLAHRNAVRLRKLVNNLLDFSRLEAGRLKIVPEPTDLRQATLDITALFRSTIEGAGLQFAVTFGELPSAAAVDRDMWEKIISNFLSNAYKYTLEGEIELNLQQRGEHIVLSVRDTGVGISSEDAVHLFERFYRVAGGGGRTEEGVGIGLAMVKELVALHGGTVAVTSFPGQGSTFTAALPLIPLAAGESAQPPRPWQASTVSALDLRDQLSGAVPTPAASFAPGRPEGRVLVADDNADMAAFLARVLGSRWSVEFATDGLQALESIKANPPDVLISDVMMPRLDGLQLVQTLRSDPATRTLPIILLSARAGEEARVEGLSVGADDYLTKPFSARELLARVDNQLMRSRLGEFDRTINRKLAEVFSHAPVGIALLDGPTHRFEFVNPSYVELAPGREFVGRTVAEVFPDLQGQGIAELLDEAYTSGRPVTVRSYKLDLVTPASGSVQPRYFDFVYQPMPDPDGNTRKIAVVVFDVSELSVARQAADSANRTKDEFIAMLGHELRNPLAPIVTALQLMRLRPGDMAVKERGIIERQVHHMVRLVDDLLDVARFTRGDFQLQRELLEIWNVVTKAIETASPLLEQKRHALHVQVPARGLGVSGDPVRLTQVLSNLLVNAAKFTNAEGEIFIEGERVGANVEIRVRDNGPGMTTEELTSVFQMFTQGQQSIDRPKGGLGLGLAIAQSLARMHGGELSARSGGLGKGSTFTLALPLIAATAVQEAPPMEEASSIPSVRRALIVDDNVDAATMLAELLTDWGFETDLAHDALSALRHLEEGHFDVALIDIGLPVMDGYELARQIRLNERFRHIRLVAVTGFGQAKDRARSSEHGFEAHLVKPVDLSVLRRVLH